MRCPHCNKLISIVHNDSLKKKAIALIKRGATFRDAEMALDHAANYTTIYRWFKQYEAKKAGGS